MFLFTKLSLSFHSNEGKVDEKNALRHRGVSHSSEKHMYFFAFFFSPLRLLLFFPLCLSKEKKCRFNVCIKTCICEIVFLLPIPFFAPTKRNKFLLLRKVTTAKIVSKIFFTDVRTVVAFFSVITLNSTRSMC